jgi:hypothetical protein
VFIWAKSIASDGQQQYKHRNLSIPVPFSMSMMMMMVLGDELISLIVR